VAWVSPCVPGWGDRSGDCRFPPAVYSHALVEHQFYQKTDNWSGSGRYGRTVGRVYVGSEDVNAEMVKQGAQARSKIKVAASRENGKRSGQPWQRAA